MTRTEEAAIHTDVDLPHELLDDDAIRIVRRLQEQGEEAYLVGGCVRDLIRGQLRGVELNKDNTPKDFDVITSATPRQIRRFFRNSRQIGRRFKLVHVFWGQKIIEVTTFRAPAEGSNDPRTGDGEMVFGDARSDALLRDFTINALYYDPVARELVDYVEGFRDLKRGLVRAIGGAEERVLEDPVRILRGIRYAAKLDMKIEDECRRAFDRHIDEVGKINPSRLREEVWKFLKTPGTAEAFEALVEYGAFDLLFPELVPYLDSGALLQDLEEKEFLPPERLEPGLLWALLFLGVFDEIDDLGQGEPQRELRVLRDVFEQKMEPLAIRHNVARRDRHIAREVLESLPKLLRGPGGRNRRVARRPYFPAALDLYELFLRARGRPVGDLVAWQEARVEALREDAVEPEPDHRPTRRRGRRRKRRN